MSLTPDAALRVVEFSSEECPKAPTSGPPLFTFAQFHTFRNELLSVLSQYGTIGPKGKLRMRESLELGTEVWSGAASKHPDFFLTSGTTGPAGLE
jgi:hypothetical protein